MAPRSVGNNSNLDTADYTISLPASLMRNVIRTRFIFCILFATAEAYQWLSEDFDWRCFRSWNSSIKLGHRDNDLVLFSVLILWSWYEIVGLLNSRPNRKLKISTAPIRASRGHQLIHRRIIKTNRRSVKIQSGMQIRNTPSPSHLPT